MALPSSGRALADGTFPRPFFAPVTLLWRGGSEPGLLGLLAQDAIEEVAAQEAPAACLSLLLGQHSLPRPRQVLHGHDANVTGLSFGASGTLASTGQDMMVSIFATDKQQQDTLTSRHRSDSTQGYTQPPELRLPVGSSSSAPVMASCVAHSPCNTYLAVGTAQGFVEVWTLPSHGAGNAPTPPSPQGSKDAESQMHLFTDLQGHFGCVTAVAWSASGQLLASGGADGKVHIWHVASHTLLGTLERHKDMVNSVAFNPTHETGARVHITPHLIPVPLCPCASLHPSPSLHPSLLACLLLQSAHDVLSTCTCTCTLHPPSPSTTHSLSLSLSPSHTTPSACSPLAHPPPPPRSAAQL